ncbi:MAG: hypothetical protein P0S95_06245 [Rhabdochlamydiaceae bacterium]|nr:hypothetical protein [Candidatus Amphrikana amoebophyrae]
MKKLLVLACLLTYSSLLGAKEINLSLDDCLFIKYRVPKKGVICSNHERALRLSKKLDNTEVHKSSWGPFIAIGEYRNEPIFIGCAPVGSGAGLLFTELFVAGAQYIIRYGSDDVKKPPLSDALLVKIVDEADNLYGYQIQSGVASKKWGMPIKASQKMVDSLKATAKSKGVNYEMRICHHLENYHSLRSPEKFSPSREKRLQALLNRVKRTDKKESFDMETAVLFQVAQDFDLHAATILQTVDKEGLKLRAYEGENFKKALEIEENIFFDFVLDGLLEI